MESPVNIQDVFCTNVDYSLPCSVSQEVMCTPAVPLIHQMSRFWLIREGRGVLRLQDRTYELRPGAFVSVLPWQISNIVSISEPLSFYILTYYFYNMSCTVKALSAPGTAPVPLMDRMRNTPVVYCSEKELNFLSGILAQLKGMTDEVSSEKSSGLLELSIANKLVETVLFFLRLQERETAPLRSNTSIQKSDIIHYIYNHLSKKLTLADLSSRFFLSESAISDYIRQTTGFSFFDLLNEMRVGKAIHLLLCTGLRQEELAGLLGFVDTPHFCRVFSERTGLTPGEFRRTYQSHSEFYSTSHFPASFDVISYIYHNYSENLTPGDVAARFHMTPQDLNAVLLYQVEKDFHQFLNFIRVNRASELLKTTKKTITEIALEVGYNNEKALTRNFLKHRTMTPTMFRRTVELQENALF